MSFQSIHTPRSLKFPLLIGGFLLLLCAKLAAQPTFRLNVPISIGVAASLAKSEQDSGAQWTQGIGAMIQLRAGIGLRYKDIAGIDAEAGYFLNSTIFRQGSNEYSLTQYDPQIAGQFYMMRPCPTGSPCSLRLAFGYGWSFISPEVLTNDDGLFFARTTTPKIRIPFIAPEIGISANDDKSIFDFSLRYTYHTQAATMYESYLASDDGRTSFSSKGNSIGLVLRYRPILNTKIKPPKSVPPLHFLSPEKLKDFEGRTTEKSKSLVLHRKNVTLFIRDNADFDGDSLSVTFNGSLILEDYLLTKKQKKIKLALDNGSNTLMVYALNEGSISPNTAECILRSGFKKHKLILTSSFKRNEAIELILED